MIWPSTQKRYAHPSRLGRSNRLFASRNKIHNVEAQKPSADGFDLEEFRFNV